MILITANTYYQVIMAIQMNNTIFANQEVVLLISNHSRNAETIVRNIQNLRIFKECLFIETRDEVFNPSLLQKIIDCIQIGLCKKNRFEYSIKDIEKYSFDELIYFNEGLFIDGHFSILSRSSKDLKLSLYEEGILSYWQRVPHMKRRTLIGVLRKFFSQKTVEESLNCFYCFYPQLYNGNMKAVAVPTVSSNSKTAKELIDVFQISYNSSYHQKYIFFTSVYDFEGGTPIGEYDLVCKVAELVGRDNLLIKMHPRDTRTIYADNGFSVDKNSAIPWEAIQLSRDFSDKVYMTVNSGSVLSGNTMSEKPVKTYYMYKLCNISGNPSCQRNAADIEKLLSNESMKKILRTVHVAERIEDIL